MSSTREYILDRVLHQQGLWTTDSENCLFHLYFICVIRAMKSPHFHAISCNVYMQSHDYTSDLWARISVAGEENDFSFGCLNLV